MIERVFDCFILKQTKLCIFVSIYIFLIILLTKLYSSYVLLNTCFLYIKQNFIFLYFILDKITKT